MQKRLFWLFALFAFGFAAAGVLIYALAGAGWLLLLLPLLLCGAAVLAHVLVKKLQKTLAAIDLSHPEETNVCAELAPFAKRLDEQNRTTGERIDALHKEHASQDEMRREFTANVSHELKTPLTSISGYAELIRDGIASPEDVPRFAGRICDESARLVTLVGDILKLSRLDTGKLDASEDVDLFDLCGRVLARLELAAKKRGITLSLCGEHAHVHTDRRLAEDILHNLCDNAVKYNRENGSVTVTLCQCVDGVEVSVSDTGVGIAAEDLKHIFERFYRVDKSRSTDAGGTGLGLSIVKNGARLLGASVTVESEPERGTTFRLLF